MFHNERSLGIIQSALDEFEKQSHIHVNLNVLNWQTGYSELTKGAIYGRGPDVSEIGTTWVSGLTAMNALRPFSPQDMAQIGKPEEFIPASWNTCRIPSDERMWAIPYTANIYSINYRKDLLQKAGIDEASAFQSHAQIAKTVRQLAQSGVQMPVVLSEDRYALLHAMTSWLWAQGGDFCTPDGKQILFDRPESLAAISAYFGLLRGLSPDVLKMAASQPYSVYLFCEGQSAIHFYDLSVREKMPEMLPNVLENWGVTPFPKPSFMGGTNLVIWQHSPHVEAAMALVQFLTSVPSMAQAVIPFQMLPPRLAVMETPEFLQDQFLKNLGDVANAGRSYPSVKLWGMIEKRFVDVLFDIRSIVLSDPSVDLDALIQNKVIPVAERLNIAITQ